MKPEARKRGSRKPAARTSKGRTKITADATLSHAGRAGEARMVDVGTKFPTPRVARAEGRIRMTAAAFRAIRANALKKGDVLGVARLAGVQAAKRTPELIPLCHTLLLTDVQVVCELDAKLPGVRVESTARTVAQTGVEMEALTATAVALLTVYDMTKSMGKGMVIERVRLLEKTGGKSGDWRAR